MREVKIDEVVEEMDKVNDDTKMFSAIKQLQRKRPQNKVVHDAQGKNVTNEKEMHAIVQQYFSEHFFDETKPEIKPFVGTPNELMNPITPDEVSECVRKMSNNKSPGDDEITVELIKYGPLELITEIAKTLNNILEQHNLSDTDIGKSILVTIQKPQKLVGPVKNLRPINLLNVIRKILSNITLARINDSVNRYLSASQSAYRKGRSTSDIVWAHRWVAAKAQKFQNTTVYITGIDMSAAFDTVERHKLLDELSRIVGDDELRMCRLLLSQTTITIQNNKVKTEPFTTNVGSPQGDGISGTFFNIYFERALRKIRETMNEGDPAIEHSYSTKSSLPQELIYADDCDFVTNDNNKRQKLNSIVTNTLASENLKVNNDKTEHTIIERKQRHEEKWRSAKKVGSLLGDSEDVISRKQLASAAMTNMEKIWVRKNKININKRIKLYNSLVKPVLTYNSSTWGLTRSELDSLDSFHRQQIRKVHKNSRLKNRQVYKLSRSAPLSQEITKSRMRLFGHILCMDTNSPAQKAMQYYFESNQQNKQFRGRPRITLPTVLNNDIKAAASQNQNIPESFESIADLHTLRQLAADRSAWKEFSILICDTAQVNRSTPFRSTSQDGSA